MSARGSTLTLIALMSEPARIGSPGPPTFEECLADFYAEYVRGWYDAQLSTPEPPASDL